MERRREEEREGERQRVEENSGKDSVGFVVIHLRSLIHSWFDKIILLFAFSGIFFFLFFLYLNNSSDLFSFLPCLLFLQLLLLTNQIKDNGNQAEVVGGRGRSK